MREHMRAVFTAGNARDRCEDGEALTAPRRTHQAALSLCIERAFREVCG